MRRLLCLSVIAATCIFSLVARADLVIVGDAPTFSSEEKLVIARNRSLKALMTTDPILVRRALDAIAASSSTGSREARKARDADKSGKPSRDPDLDGLVRSSPEASHDLIVLIKNATAGKKR